MTAPDGNVVAGFRLFVSLPATTGALLVVRAPVGIVVVGAARSDLGRDGTDDDFNPSKTTGCELKMLVS